MKYDFEVFPDGINLHATNAAERSLSVSAKPLPKTEHQASADDTARSSAPSLWDRIATWLRSWSGDVEFTTHAVCAECERACFEVTGLESSWPCVGRPQLANCTICPETVQLTITNKCPNDERHVYTNRRDKPRMRLCCMEAPDA